MPFTDPPAPNAPARRRFLLRSLNLSAAAVFAAPALAGRRTPSAGAPTPGDRDDAAAAAEGPRGRVVPAVQLARVAPQAMDPRGWLVSEKFDGVRAVWDGTRLRYRSGAAVSAPPWFLAALPPLPLDGELWRGRGAFESLVGVVRQARPSDLAWRDVRYQVFDLPGAPGSFEQRAERLAGVVRGRRFEALVAVEQRRLADRSSLQRHLDAVVHAGGEGLMLHRADAAWRPGRSDALLKLKPEHDAEARVVAHVAGRGRLAGRLGALRVRTPQGTEFLLGTGLSDAWRERPPAVGSWVTYRHRGWTAAGVPRFASFLRVHDPHAG